MMMNLSCDVILALKGRTLVTAESCTGGGIGAALTAVPGSSSVYKGGLITYTNELKISQLGVDPQLLEKYGAVSSETAEAMAVGARNRLNSDIAISVTGLAGPRGDDFGNSVGTVYIGYCDANGVYSKKFSFSGSREDVRRQAIISAMKIILSNIS